LADRDRENVVRERRTPAQQGEWIPGDSVPSSDTSVDPVGALTRVGRGSKCLPPRTKKARGSQEVNLLS